MDLAGDSNGEMLTRGGVQIKGATVGKQGACMAGKEKERIPVGQPQILNVVRLCTDRKLRWLAYRHAVWLIDEARNSGG